MTLDLALSHASTGLPVFPCSPENKRPLTSNGFRAATTAERIIRIWAERHPGCLWAMPTGERTGCWVLDFDPRHGGTPESLPHSLPPTRTVRTRSGGQHFYFKHAGLGCSPGRLPPGIDVRGTGGLVILPGNPGYTLEADEPVAAAPEWLLALIRPKPYVPQPGAPYTPGDHDAYVDAALRAELDALASTRIERGFALYRAAFKVGTLVGAGGLSRQEAEHGLLDAAYRNGGLATDGERETAKRIQRGLDNGVAQPRTLPERDSTPSVDVTGMIERHLARKAA